MQRGQQELGAAVQRTAHVIWLEAQAVARAASLACAQIRELPELPEWLASVAAVLVEQHDALCQRNRELFGRRRTGGEPSVLELFALLQRRDLAGQLGGLLESVRTRDAFWSRFEHRFDSYTRRIHLLQRHVTHGHVLPRLARAHVAALARAGAGATTSAALPFAEVYATLIPGSRAHSDGYLEELAR